LLFKEKKKNILLSILFVFSFYVNAQITNYVSNGSFEDLKDCNPPSSWLDLKMKGWSSIDTTKSSFRVLNTCLQNVPVSGSGYQTPRTGKGFVLATLLCDPNSCNSTINRGYFRNKLKTSLKANTVYCVRFHINIINLSPFGIDAFGAHFSNNSLDTIKYHMVPITYLMPQIQNPIGNIISDTMNWTPITGTFTANGTEKFMVIGNFKSDVNTMKAQIQPTFTYAWCDVNLDDVSCIELNLPAFAGRDTSIFAGNSVFLGRQPDVGIDDACKWYKLPTIITPTTPAIDTVAGFWVNPITTSTYVVRQEICGLVKWDTVVVYMDAVGIEKFNLLKNDLRLFPNPAQDILQMQFTVDVENEFKTIRIYNNLGQLLREEDLIFKNKTASIKTDDLRNGVYVLKLHSKSLQTVSRRFIINR